jgi:hypothetical protein
MFNLGNRFALVRDENGMCQIGGHTPSALVIPDNKCPGSFQYLGLISHKDPAFEWLSYDINLICPIYMNIEQVWVDYSEPLAPSIVNIDEVNSLTTEYDDIENGSRIVFEDIQCSSVLLKQAGDDYLALAGKPDWVQSSNIPACPKTKKKMRFLCQLVFQDEGKIKTKYTNVASKDDWYQQYFQEMNFWGDGDLYIFFSPESNLACYFIQNT